MKNNGNLFNNIDRSLDNLRFCILELKRQFQPFIYEGMTLPKDMVDYLKKLEDNQHTHMCEQYKNLVVELQRQNEELRRVINER